MLFVFWLQCCNLQLVENLKDPLCFRVSDQTIPKQQQHVVQVSRLSYRSYLTCLLSPEDISPFNQKPSLVLIIGWFQVYR